MDEPVSSTPSDPISDVDPISTTSEAAEAAIEAFDEAEQAEHADPEQAAEAPAAVDTVAEPADPAKADPAPEPEKAVSEADQLMLDAGYDKDEKQRIPKPKVRRIIENGLRKGREAFDLQRTTLETELKTSRGQLAELQQGVTGDPRAFLTELASIDTRYKVFLEPPAAPAEPARDDDPEPGPDLPIGNGQKTFSLEGMRAVREWDRRQSMKEIDTRLQPFTDREKAAGQRTERQAFERQLHQTMSTQMQEAQTWPLFGSMAQDGSLTPFQQEVLGALEADSTAARAAGQRPRLTLEGAYLKISAPRFAENDKAMRARILAELNTAPKGTSVSRGPTDAPRTGTVSTSDIAAKTLARLERGG